MVQMQPSSFIFFRHSRLTSNIGHSSKVLNGYRDANLKTSSILNVFLTSVFAVSIFTSSFSPCWALVFRFFCLMATGLLIYHNNTHFVKKLLSPPFRKVFYRSNFPPKTQTAGKILLVTQHAA